MPWTMGHIDSRVARRRPVCKKDFGRRPKRERHVRDKRMPRRRCPFLWSRPSKIRAHLMIDHAKIFATDIAVPEPVSVVAG